MWRRIIWSGSCRSLRSEGHEEKRICAVLQAHGALCLHCGHQPVAARNVHVLGRRVARGARGDPERVYRIRYRVLCGLFGEFDGGKVACQTL